MDYEYAVDPKDIASDWYVFRYVWSLFGFSKGRLISQFPKNWFKEVYDAVDNIEKFESESTNLHLIRQKLEEERKRQIGTGDCRVQNFHRQRHYNKTFSWISNALNEHERENFGDILALEKKESSSVLSMTNLDEEKDLVNNDQWASPIGQEELISKLEIFLRFGRRIAFIDPYFRIDSKVEHKNVREFLSNCLSKIKKHNPIADCEIHYRDHENYSMPSISHIENKSKIIGSLIPCGMQITIYCWRKHSSIEFHDRYLLTDKGGLHIGKGFRIEEGEKTSVGFHSAEAAEEILSSFNGSGHHLVDYALRIDSNGGSERIHL